MEHKFQSDRKSWSNKCSENEVISQFSLAKASQLSDIVRATLMFKIRPNVITDIYAAIEEIVFMSELNGVRSI